MQVEIKEIKHTQFGINFFLVIVMCFLLGTSCDTTFQTRQKNDQYYFSIFGMLDASVDTQWVRVMPVREEFFLEPGKQIDAIVTLEHLETGDSIVMNDSLFRYHHDVYAWNFWTTMDLLPEHTYRLTARNSDENSSYAEVTLPSDFPTPVVRRSTNFEDPHTIWIDKSIGRLIDVQTVYHGRDPLTHEEHVMSFPHLQDTTRSSTDFHIIRFERFADDLSGFMPVFKSLVFVAAGNDEHPDFGSIDEKTLAIPEGISNIENGVGYLAGIVSKAVPFRSCFEEDGFTLRPCPVDPDTW